MPTLPRLPVRLLLTATVLLFLGALLACILVFPRLIYPPLSAADLRDVKDGKDRVQLQEDRLRLQNDARTTLLQALGGAFLIVTAALTWEQVKNGRRQLQQIQEASQAELRLSRDGQITDRFTRAIDQLASTNHSVRLGAIHALGRIAENSPRDTKAIAEILNAYINEHGVWAEDGSQWIFTEEALDSLPSLKVRAADVQAAIVVLGHLGLVWDDTDPLQLSNLDLRKGHLYDISLEGAYLSGTHLEGADLSGAELAGAKLYGAQLQKANLAGAQLEEASLIDADLEWATLSRARLGRALLGGANLENAHLGGANLQEAYLGATRLTGAYLGDADLTDAHLDGTRLGGAFANAATKWPDDFDAAAAGVAFTEDPM